MPTPLPASTDFTDSSVTEGGAKTFVTNLRAFLAGLLGTDGAAATARTALGLGSLATQSADAVAITGGTIAGIVLNPRGHIAGLTLSNNATATKLDVAAGSCRDSTNVTDITLSAPIVAGLIQTSGAWAAGDTQNKLDTGARANSTWYHVWAIKKDSDGSGEFLFSLSVSAPTMPSGYTYKRRIGSVKTDGSGNIISFVQDGDYFTWLAAILDVDATNPGTSAVSRTLTVPTGVNVFALINVITVGWASNGPHCLVSDLTFTDVAPSTSAAPLYNAGIGGLASGSFYGQMTIRTNTSAQIRTRQGSSGNGEAVRIATVGWFDTRGRNT